MTTEGQPRTGRVLRGALLLVPLLLACWWLWSRPRQGESPFDDALDSALAPVMRQSELLQEFRNLTRAQARLLARDLAARSVPDLGARDLELWAATRARVARASQPACARLWKGGDDDFLGPAIADLGPEVLDAHVEMLARALALRLELLRLQRKPEPPASVATIQRGIAAIAAQLPAAERAAFEQDVGRPDVSDVRACQLYLTVSTGAESLEPQQRREFYRALASALPVPHGAPRAAPR